ncbi:hypothetical protein DOTSEDRAFT_82684 [Dothistroma septosporum NZE10]|uniref:Protein SQS1 n=1 Tax=Dothistroma septosporum (strain NZE10 / CBS 128990) TaxID=675120 RepID=N1PCF4_DOTSN|nr:hypothetical protein DOTSEDRAFT_82684 [Dothistroma septosporum NZE10]
MGKKKAQNGRAKQKQKAKAGNTPRTPKANHAQQQMLADSDWDEDTPIHFRGFTQQNSPSSTTLRSANAAPKLRHAGISFVSAGLNTSSLPQPQDPDADIALDHIDSDEDGDEDIDDSLLQTNIMEADIEIPEQGMANMHIHTLQMEIEDDTATAFTSDINVTGIDTSAERRPGDAIMSDGLFVVDTVGDASLTSTSRAHGKRPIKRAPSPARSDSSEEVIVFHGRSKPNIVNDPVTRTSKTAPTPPARSSRTQSPHVTDDLLKALNTTSAPSSLPTSGWGSRPTKQINDTWEAAPETPYWKKSKGRPRPDLGPSAAEIKRFERSPPKESKVQFAESNRKSKEKDMDAEDTVAALQADWKKTLRDKKAMKPEMLELASNESSKPSKSSKRRNKRGRKKDNRAMRAAITSDEDASDGEAAYDDYMQNLKAQLDGADDDDATLLASLSARGRFPPAMMVDGQQMGDDELLPKHSKDGPEPKGDYELDDDSDWEDEDDSEMNPDPDELSTDDSREMDSSDLEDELEYAEREQWKDEDDLRQRRMERMTDEQIARLLAKQEELGMGSDELLLDNGIDISDDGFGDLVAARAGLGDLSKYSFGRSAMSHSMRKHRGDRKENFPDASVLADAVDQYGENGFDIMDFDRPSLRPRKKGRKGQLPEELEMLSDEDLKEELRDHWDNDRGKKAAKKAEREELRREGLLGSGGRKGKADLSQKYPIGMNMKQVHDELRDFLRSDEHRERAFPPMAKIDRKALHEVAMALNLNSQSRGAGKKRFTIVTKTSRTAIYDQGMFNDVMSASTRGFLTNAKATRMAKRNARGSTRGARGGGRGGGLSAATVRHGELVGAGAAEISSNSFGHKMMEKMGWSKGTALGKDRDGLLVPVEQRMRVGTAGLG